MLRINRASFTCTNAFVQRRIACNTQVLARSEKDLEGRGSNVGEYCSLNEKGQRVEMSTMEKETLFIESLKSYYVDGVSSITDEEFEELKDELLWNGSEVAILSSNEQRFMEATMAFNKGEPILSNEEFDALKAALKEEGSVVVEAGPRCSLRSRRVYTDAKPEYLKMTLLNLPAAVFVLGIVFGIDFLTDFNITRAIELPPPWSILFLWGFAFPTIYIVSTSITNLVLPDALILKATCPNCGTENTAYFGGIFNTEKRVRETVAECTSCKADLKFDSIKREVVVERTGEEKAAEKAAKLAAKKAAQKKKVEAK